MTVLVILIFSFCNTRRAIKHGSVLPLLSHIPLVKRSPLFNISFVNLTSLRKEEGKDCRLHYEETKYRATYTSDCFVESWRFDNHIAEA